MKLLLILLFVSLSLVQAQIFTVQCNFAVGNNGYTCGFPFVSLEQALDVVFITRDHLQNRTNADVIGISAFSSRLNFFPTHAFEIFPNLKHIQFSGNNLPTLERNVFANRRQLITLELNSNSLRTIQDGAFENLSELTDLSLASNSFTSLPPGVFDALTNLRTLQLSSNSITRIDGLMIAQNRLLRTLDLQYNYIEVIDHNTFDNAKELQSLMLYGARCMDQFTGNIVIRNGDFSEAFIQLEKCFGVSVVNCEFEDEVQVLGATEKGYACTVRGRTMLANQRRVEFGGMHNPTWKGNYDVVQLRIQDSNISFFMSEMFSTYVNLKSVEISNGGLEEIRLDDFINAENLESIYFQYNNIKVLNGGIFSALPNLVKLSLSRNEIERIDGNAFAELSSLKQLNLKGNLLRRLNKNTLNSLVEMTELNLAENYLTRISSNLLLRNSKLRSLVLNKNQISAIEEGFLKNLPHLTLFNMRGNKCSNEIFLLSHYLMNQFLKKCFEEHKRLPAEDTRRVIMEIDGELGLSDNEGRRIIEL